MNFLDAMKEWREAREEVARLRSLMFQAAHRSQEAMIDIEHQRSRAAIRLGKAEEALADAWDKAEWEIEVMHFDPDDEMWDAMIIKLKRVEDGE